MNALKKLTDCSILSTVKQEEDEAGWLAARTRGIGGSDIGAICGVSPFSSARKIYFNKTGQYQDALKPDGASSERMYFGHVLEPVVADEYAKRTGEKLITVEATLQRNDNKIALANVDRLIVDDDGNPIGILECKTTSEYMNSEWESGEILMSYIYQLNWYLYVTGLQRGAFACLVGGNKFYYYDVYRNDELINDVLIPAAKEFWEENVMKMIEPEMQSTDTDFANTMYDKVEKGAEIFMEDDAANDLAEVVVECKAKIKELEKTMKEAQNRLKDRLKENELGYTKDYVVKWSPRSQRRVDSTTLKTEYPEVYEKCLKVTSFRVMTIKGGTN